MSQELHPGDERDHDTGPSARATHCVALASRGKCSTGEAILRFRGSNHIDASINLVLKG
jgi:hypothetical protein